MFPGGLQGRVLRVLGFVAAAAALGGVGVAFALLPWEIQIAAVVAAAVVVAAIWFIPRAVQKEPSVTVTLLSVALAAKLVGAGVRYGVLQAVYGGVGDAVGYHSSGVQYTPLIRSLDFSFLDFSTLGTPVVGYITGFVYAVITPSMPAAFVLFAMLAFIGTWCFYRAHRIAFPGGDHRLFFILLFFLPTLLYWPSSLGKDALVVFGLGVATLGLARIFREASPGAFLQLGFGVLLTFVVREAVAVMFLFGAAAGLLIRPGSVRSGFTRPISWVILTPLLLVGMVFALRVAAQQLNLEQDVESIFQKYETTRENLYKGGSSFEQPAIQSPAGAFLAAAGVLFRPFPWELGSGLGAAAGVEGLVLLGLIVTRFPRAIRSLKLWREGMIVTAVISSILLIASLSAFTNFGLLTRQRSQALPFVLMIFTAVRGRPRRRRPPGRAAQDIPTSSEKARMRSMASATAAG